MDIKIEKEGAVLVVAPVGKLDGENGIQLEQTLLPEITGNTSKVAMNMEHVVDATSDGLRGLLTLIQRATMMRGQLLLYNVNDSFKILLHESGLESFFTVVKDKHEAFGRFGE